jgi:copper resistance protein D
MAVHVWLLAETFQRLWPELVRRFAWVGGPALLALVATGLPLAWTCIGTWQGLIGTDYGVMLVIKVVLLMGALGLAALNFLGARDRGANEHTGHMFRRSPCYLEAEILPLVAILVAAVSLSMQRAAFDAVDQQATGGSMRPSDRRCHG